MKIFESIINPVSSSDFLKKNWCKEPLFLARNDNAVNNILTVEEIGDFLDSGVLTYPFLRMIGNGTELEPTLYTNSTASVAQTLDRSKVLDLFNQGNTIVIQSANLHFPKLNEFIIGISREFKTTSHANIYITPSNSKGFDPHVDPHEVFVLQVYGSKEWNLYDIPYVSPIKNNTLTAQDKERYRASGPAHVIQLQQGDVLYVPCGLVHDAYTTDTPSIHITMGVHPLRRTDLLTQVLNAAEKQDFFRQPCFPVMEEADRNELVKKFMEESVKLISTIVDAAITNPRMLKEKKRYEGVFKDIMAIDSVKTLEDISSLLQNSAKEDGGELYDLVDAVENKKLTGANEKTLGKLKFKLKDLIKQGSIKVDL